MRRLEKWSQRATINSERAVCFRNGLFEERNAYQGRYARGGKQVDEKVGPEMISLPK